MQTTFYFLAAFLLPEFTNSKAVIKILFITSGVVNGGGGSKKSRLNNPLRHKKYSNTTRDSVWCYLRERHFCECVGPFVKEEQSAVPTGQ